MRIINYIIKTNRITPTQVAFWGSMLLSLIAISSSGTLNRDGMLYVDVAQIFLRDGFAAARNTFSWPFLSLLIAIVSKLSGLTLESSGNLLNIFFMGGTAALLVASSAKLFPQAAWPICLVFLAIPGLNDYRDELLREYGCWFFMMLGIWFALCWADLPRWHLGLAAQVALCVAALFRPEALVFLPALILWQFFESPAENRYRRILMVGCLTFAGFIVLSLLYINGQLPARLYGEIGRLSVERFNEKAAAISTHFISYARDQAKTILIFGSLAIIPIKFLKMMGVFIIPLIYAFLASPFPAFSTLAKARVFSWFFVFQLIVLSIFVTDMQFLAGRYVAPLTMLAAPLTGYGLAALMRRLPQWRCLIVGMAILVMLGNVVSLKPEKTRFREAGLWLSQNVKDRSRVYIESQRTAYYAGWGFVRWKATPHDRAGLQEKIDKKIYDLIVLESQCGTKETDDWLNSREIMEVRRFFDKRDSSCVLIAKPSR